MRVSSVESDGVADVYCLTVPDGAAFSVNGGIVVSNCAESTRYLLMSRPKPVPVAGAGVAKYSAEWIDKQFRSDT